MINETPATHSALEDNQRFYENEIDIFKLIGTLVEFKWLISIIGVIFLIGGVFYTLIATPIYQADALLQIEEKSSSALGLDNLDDIFSAATLARTEIEIIKSRNIIGKVVDRLNLTINAKPRYFPIIGAAIARRHSGSHIANAYFDMNHYAWGGEKIKLEQLSLPNYSPKYSVILVAGNNQKYTVKNLDGKQLLTGQVGKLASGRDIKIFVSQLIAKAGTEFSLDKNSRIKAINNLQKNIKVFEQGKNTGILKISLNGNNPMLINHIVDNIANFYLRQNVERLSEEAKSSLKFLQRQLPLIKNEMEAAEVKLNDYRSIKSSVNLTLETQSLLNRIITIESQLAALEIKYSDLTKKYTKAHPIMVTLINQETKLKEQLDQINTKAHRLPKTQQEFLRLSRDVEVATTIYTQLLNNMQELKVAKAGTVGNVRIIDTALTAKTPIKPNKFLIILLSLVFGLFLGVVIAFMRRAMNKGIEDPDIIESNIGIPVYANIPFSTKQTLLTKELVARKIKHAILCEYDCKDKAIEGLRSLRTHLHFALFGAKNNIVMITGPAPSLGKSFISVNFAHIVAKTGKKVLLIDADMRKGHIHKTYNMTRIPGLSELIIKKVDKESAVRHTGFENIDVITTGSIPLDPSELLMNENFKKYLNEISKDYDLVLIDTPPLLAVTDAAVIGNLCGTIFVLLRYGMHSMAEINAVIKLLRQNNIEPKGFIFNALVPHKWHNKNGIYYYDYQ